MSENSDFTDSLKVSAGMKLNENDPLVQQIRYNTDGKGTVSSYDIKQAYERFVYDMKKTFLTRLKEINELIAILIAKGKVTTPIELYARIKSFKSTAINDMSYNGYLAIRDNEKNEYNKATMEATYLKGQEENGKNYNHDDMRKSVDDIFGFAILCDSETTLNILRTEIKKMLKSKSNGKYNDEYKEKALEDGTIRYRAYHGQLDFDSASEEIPYEIQYRTFEWEHSNLNHEAYKDNGHALTKKELQDKYNLLGVDGFENIIPPLMYYSINGVLESEPMSNIRKLKKIYPGLDTSRPVKKPDLLK